MKGWTRLFAAGALGAMVLGLPASAGASPSTTCTDELAPGTYGKVIVPSGAVCLGEGPVTIRGGLLIQSGATFVLGSEENPVNTGTISGGVHATDAASVQIHFTTINGGVDVRGGSGPFGGPFDITWNAIEDNWISGGATVAGYDGFWFGFIRNHVNGSVNLNNNVLEDPDGNEYVTNSIQGSLNCSGNSPAPQVGDSEGSPNDVTASRPVSAWTSERREWRRSPASGQGGRIRVAGSRCRPALDHEHVLGAGWPAKRSAIQLATSGTAVGPRRGDRHLSTCGSRPSRPSSRASQ